MHEREQHQSKCSFRGEREEGGGSRINLPPSSVFAHISITKIIRTRSALGRRLNWNCNVTSPTRELSTLAVSVDRLAHRLKSFKYELLMDISSLTMPNADIILSSICLYVCLLFLSSKTGKSSHLIFKQLNKQQLKCNGLFMRMHLIIKCKK